jgi:hypothetical protein
MAETIEPRDLVVGQTYQIYNPDFSDNVRIGDISKPIIGNFVGIDPLSGEAQFNNVLGIHVRPQDIINYTLSGRHYGWVVKMDAKNTAMHKKKIFNHEINGTSLMEELVQKGPWHPNRIERARSLGFQANYFNGDEEWEPTVVGYGCGSA